MMIRTRLRLLAWGSLLTVLLAITLSWWGYQLMQTERQRHDSIQRLRTAAINLNVMTLDLLHATTPTLPARQWLAIYRNLDSKIEDAPLRADPAYPILKEIHAKIGERFENLLQAHARCREKHRDLEQPGCRTLLTRLGTQIRLAVQDLFVEISRAEQRIADRLSRYTAIGSLLLLSLLATLSLWTVIIVLPMTRRLSHGLTRLMDASQRFSRGHFDHRLPVEKEQDEIGILSATYNDMATRRETAEQALLNSKANLSEAQHIAHIGSWELNLRNGELAWSEELFRIFEIDRHRFEASYQAFLDRVHPDDRQRVDAAYSRSLAERTEYDIVHRLLFDDGRVKHIRERCKTEYDVRGKPVRSIGTAQDISESVRIERQLHYRLGLEGAIARASTQLARAGEQDLDARIDTVLATIGQAVGADRSYLFQLEDDSDTFSNTHEWCADGVASQMSDLQQVPTSEFDPAFERFRADEVVKASDPGELHEDLAPLGEFMRQTGIRSLINVPITTEGRLRGVIGFDIEKHPRAWPDEDIRLLRTVAENLGGALARQEAARRIAEHTWFLESLDRISAVLAGKQAITPMLRELTTLILELFAADRAWLLQTTPRDDTRYLVPVEATRPEYPGMLASGAEISKADFNPELMRRILASDSPLSIHTDDLENPPDYLKTFHIQSRLIMPIRSTPDAVWLLGLHQCASRREWSPAEQRLFKAIAERIGLALAGAELLENLQHSEQRLLEAERIARTGSWELRLPSGETHWSRQEYRCLGYAENAVEASFDALIAAAHRDDRDWVEDRIRSVIDGKNATCDIQHRVVWPDGSEHIVHQLAIIERDDQGRPLRLLGTTQDVSERVRMEQELEFHRQHLEQLVEERTATIRQQVQIIDQTHVAVLTTDLDGGITSWNGGAERLFGFSDEETIGRHVSLIQADKDPGFLHQRIVTPLKARGQYEIEPTLSRRDGSTFPAHLSLSMLYDDDGAPSGMVGYVLDISELRKRERQLQALAERLEASNKELESFSYSVSHDLRTPLRAIDGFSLALAEDYAERLDATALDYLQRVRNGAQRMGMLIDDLLQLSRVNRAELRHEAVDLAAIAREVIEELRHGEPQRQVSFSIDDDMHAEGDPRLLRAMLANLLGNAWKFTARETRARIAFRRDTRHPGVFVIQDNGVGFDMRHADKLFGAFQRLHRDSDFPGTGIGLATVQRIVHRHGGWVRARAREGEGATFSFSLQSDTLNASSEPGRNTTGPHPHGEQT